jgi:hypothetical protein
MRDIALLSNELELANFYYSQRLRMKAIGPEMMALRIQLAPPTSLELMLQTFMANHRGSIRWT